jgi:hypothetical protein
MKHNIDCDQKWGTWGRALGTALCALLLTPACSSGSADDGGASEDEAVGPGVELTALEVGSVTLKSGNVVSWHELEPGLLLTRESFTHPSPPALDVDADMKSLTAVELYRRLAPESAVPEGLLAAFSRSQMLAFVDDSTAVDLVQVKLDGSSVSEAGDGLARAQQRVVDDSACSWAWFSPHCDLCATGPCGGWRVSWPQITGDSSISHKSTMQLAAMCVYRGAVRHVFRLRGKDIQDTIQRAGNGTRYFLNNGSHGFTLGSRVEQAAGDGYHHCAAASD